MVCLLDDGFNRPAANMSSTVCSILTLKSYNLVYSVQFVNTFCYFLVSKVAKFYDQMPFLIPIQYGVFFVETPSLDDCQPTLSIKTLSGIKMILLVSRKLPFQFSVSMLEVKRSLFKLISHLLWEKHQNFFILYLKTCYKPIQGIKWVPLILVWTFLS